MPQFRGEPLIDKRFIDFCEILEKAKIHFGFSTNATLLTKEISDILLKFKYFRTINFSVDGFTSSTYEKIRIGANYATVMANIHYFLSAVQLRHNVGVAITFVCQDDNREEVNDFIRFWYGKLSIQINTLCVGRRPVSFFWKPERISCTHIFNNMIVLTDGRVLPCCRDEASFNLGNLAENTLEEIWNGKKYNSLRNAQLSGEYDKFPLCANCDTWMTSITERKQEILDNHITMQRGPFWTNIPLPRKA